MAGVRYRRINQAFFAFRGGYATQLGAASPYGPLFEGLRARSGSVADFVAAIRGVGSVSDADAVLGSALAVGRGSFRRRRQATGR